MLSNWLLGMVPTAGAQSTTGISNSERGGQSWVTSSGVVPLRGQGQEGRLDSARFWLTRRRTSALRTCPTHWAFPWAVLTKF